MERLLARLRTSELDLFRVLQRTCQDVNQFPPTDTQAPQFLQDLSAQEAQYVKVSNQLAQYLTDPAQQEELDSVRERQQESIDLLQTTRTSMATLYPSINVNNVTETEEQVLPHEDLPPSEEAAAWNTTKDKLTQNNANPSSTKSFQSNKVKF